jgi:ketosteroid isomerase-like protein
MSQENVEVVRLGNEWFRTHGSFPTHLTVADFVWDMTHFRGWPERSTYEGIEGVQSFLAEWGSTWDDWRIETQALHDAGEKVVAIVKQHGRSKLTGMPLEMTFAMVWTIREGKEARMEMYSDPSEAFAAVGLEE